MALNARQRLFVQHYVLTKNATQSAILAGYSEKTAGVIGAENLTKPYIASEIEALTMKEEEKVRVKIRKAGVTKERWLREIAAIAFADMDDFAQVMTNCVSLIPTNERKKGKGRVIKKITETTNQNGGSQSIELHPKLPALELIGKHMGWLKDQMEVSGPNGQPIETRVVDETEVKAILEKIHSEF